MTVRARDQLTQAVDDLLRADDLFRPVAEHRRQAEIDEPEGSLTWVRRRHRVRRDRSAAVQIPDFTAGGPR
jgi:hypothetical protein